MDTFAKKCPPKAQLRLHALAQLDEEASANVQAHLEHCDLCGETFSVLKNPLSDTDLPEGNAGVGERIDQVSQEDVIHDLIPPPIADVQVPVLAQSATDYGFLAPPQHPGDLGSLGTYRVIDVLGQGGMGIVFRAEDPKLQRVLALKVIKPDLATHAVAKQRFLREAQAIAAIDDDHIVSIYQVSDDEVPYLAMPLLKGQTLADRMRSPTPLSITDSLRIAREISMGLAAAHKCGVIHRDIKPANVWLEQNSERVKLLDFGLARPVDGDSELTNTGAIAGTPQYMAPEQIAAQEIDARARTFTAWDAFSTEC